LQQLLPLSVPLLLEIALQSSSLLEFARVCDQRCCERVAIRMDVFSCHIPQQQAGKPKKKCVTPPSSFFAAVSRSDRHATTQKPKNQTPAKTKI
jgi:hypothetical protein